VLPSHRSLLLALATLAVGAGAADAQAVATPPAPARARAGAAATDSAALARIRAEGMERSRVLRTATILSDVFGPRLAGSPGFRRAAEWTRRELASYGLADAALEPWGTRRGRSWEVARQSLELTAPYYARLRAQPKAWSPPTDGVVRGTPLVVSIRDSADVARYGATLRGRILLNGAAGGDTSNFAPQARRFSAGELDSLAALREPGEPRDYWADSDGYAESVARRQRVAIALRAAGALVVLEPSRNAAALMVTGYQAYDSDVSGAVPALVVDRGDFARLAHLVQLADSAGQPAPVVAVELAVRGDAPRTRADSTGYNVVAELPGSDPALRGEVVMVGGHFDTWTPGTGATDNAAGVAVAMEALRLLQATGARPRRTIRIALWDGEEHEDYFGSLGYVRKHFGDPVTMRLLPAHARVSAYFNFDNGTGRVRGIYLQGNEAVRPLFARMLAPLADLGATTLTLKNVGSTDHMPFTSVGIPAFTFMQDPIAYEPLTHHTDADVAANLVEGDLRQAAVVTASVLLQTANLPERLPRRPLPPARAARAQ
jgi:hypothetical protein